MAYTDKYYPEDNQPLGDFLGYRFTLGCGDLYSSPNTVHVIKWRRIRWDEHVARIGKERGVYRVLVGKPVGRNHWGDLGVDG